METKNEKRVKINGINNKGLPAHYMKGMKRPTAAQIAHWDTRLTRGSCSLSRGEHKWLKYEWQIGEGLFFAAVAEYAIPQASDGAEAGPSCGHLHSVGHPHCPHCGGCLLGIHRCDRALTRRPIDPEVLEVRAEEMKPWLGERSYKPSLGDYDNRKFAARRI